MSAELLTTLPGDIFGLLRRGSPVRTTEGAEGVIVENPAGCTLVLTVRNFNDDLTLMGVEALTALRLDLTDPTGRAHAAAYAYHHPATQGFTGLMHDEHAAMESALHFDDMTPAQIDTLARLVLRLAGRQA